MGAASRHHTPPHAKRSPAHHLLAHHARQPRFFATELPDEPLTPLLRAGCGASAPVDAVAAPPEEAAAEGPASPKTNLMGKGEPAGGEGKGCKGLSVVVTGPPASGKGDVCKGLVKELGGLVQLATVPLQP